MDATRFKRKDPDPAIADFWNNKHPTTPVTYEGRSIPNSAALYRMDVRRFIWPEDVILEDLIRTDTKWLKTARETDQMDQAA